MTHLCSIVKHSNVDGEALTAMPTSVFSVGFSLILLGTLFFLATWAIVIKKPNYLLGTITMLWFKTLRQVISVGLILLILGEANQLLTTFLSWRR
jgi:hypothetical protein